MNECPSQAELLAYLQGHLPPAQNQGLEAHLESCQACVTAIASLGSELFEMIEALKIQGSTAIELSNLDHQKTKIAIPKSPATMPQAPIQDAPAKPPGLTRTVGSAMLGLALGITLSFALMSQWLPKTTAPPRSAIEGNKAKPPHAQSNTAQDSSQAKSQALAKLAADISQQLRAEANSLEDQRQLYDTWQALLKRSRGTPFEASAKRQTTRLRKFFEQKAQFYLKSQEFELERAVQEWDWDAIEDYISDARKLYPTELKGHLNEVQSRLDQQRQNYSKIGVYEYGLRAQGSGQREIIEAGLKATPIHMKVHSKMASLILSKPNLSTLKLDFNITGQVSKCFVTARLACAYHGRLTRNYAAYTDYSVNGQLLCGRYSPKTYNWNQHDWDISELIKPGQNSLTLKLHPEASNHLWIESIRILALANKKPVKKKTDENK